MGGATIGPPPSPCKRKMRIKDRTAEFFAAVSLKSNLNGPYVQAQFDQHLLPSGGAPKSPRSVVGQHTRFTMAALEINNGIKSLLGTLEKLTKLANSKRIYDDRSADVAELTFKVKKELTALTQKINDLRLISQQKQDDSSIHNNRATEDHRNNVVGLLQSQLASVSTKFTQVLQVSSSNMRAQRDRREQFGSTVVLPPNPNVAGASQRAVPKQRSGTASVGEDSSHVAIEMPFQKMALTEQTDTSYLQSRNTALQGIEATINELGSIYQQLAHMISQQGEAVQRIDMNIESMQMNVQRGQEQLMRYLRSVSSNRWLMIKIFAVLIVFTVMFMFIFT